jgi:hypothetical protein
MTNSLDGRPDKAEAGTVQTILGVHLTYNTGKRNELKNLLLDTQKEAREVEAKIFK